MSDTHQQFNEFYEKIRLSGPKRDHLRKSKRSNEERIENDFKEEERTIPIFYEQGSLPIATTINPENEGEEYDLDDGIILQNLNSENDDEWPTTDTVHGWIKDALANKTNAPVKDKRNCVRITYTADYHLDFPIYAALKNEYRLARLGEDQWVESSHPKEYAEWFRGKATEKGEQIRRVVRYLKAWNDFQKWGYKGVILTGLTVKYFYGITDRDDKSLVATIKNSITGLSNGDSINMPVTPKDDLLENWSESKRDTLISHLEGLADIGEEAINTDKLSDACDNWREIFGSRFPKVEDDDDNISVAATPVTIIGTKRSRPYYGRLDSN